MRRLEAHFTWRYKYWVPPHIAIPVGVQTRYTENRYTTYRVDHLRRYQRHGYHYEFEPPRIEMMSSVDERPRPRRTPPPRLPSPPPLTELQIGPKSPGIGAAADNYTIEGDAPESNEHGAAGRIRPGTKAAEMASGPPLKPLAEVSFHPLPLFTSSESEL